jgi:hypothetical protein
MSYACVLKKFSVGDNFDLSGFGSRSTEPIESISFRIRIHNTVKIVIHCFKNIVGKILYVRKFGREQVQSQI